MNNINVTRGNLFFFFPFVFPPHESITHAVTEQTRVCLLSWLGVPTADTFYRGFLLNFSCYKSKFTQNVCELLVHVMHILTPFSWLSQILKAPVPIQPGFLAATNTSKPLIFFPPSLNHF